MVLEIKIWPLDMPGGQFFGGVKLDLECLLVQIVFKMAKIMYTYLFLQKTNDEFSASHQDYP